LHRTILAHATELHPSSEQYFELDIWRMSTVPDEQKRERLDYILGKYKPDKTQYEAFLRSTRNIRAGIHLIQGPPGTGKTRTALIIILALASLKLRVLLAAGSNKGVDNLAVAVSKALSDKKLGSWCGQLVRFQTPAHQLSVLRKSSASTRPLRRHKGHLTTTEELLERHQIHHLVYQYAQSNQEADKNCSEFLSYIQLDRVRGLSREQVLAILLKKFSALGRVRT